MADRSEIEKALLAARLDRAPSGAQGSCELKTPQEQGRWVDGLGNEPYE